MGLEAEDLRTPVMPGDATVVRLDQEDLGRIRAFYARAYPENWFDPRMLETEHYLGIQTGGRLRAIAGLHVYSPEYRIAVLGNIATDPDFRNLGFGTFLTYELCRRLFESVSLIGLNVRAANETAIRCYQSLGFTEKFRFAEVELIQRPNRATYSQKCDVISSPPARPLQRPGGGAFKDRQEKAERRSHSLLGRAHFSVP